MHNNPLVFPIGRSPRFDPRHAMSAGCFVHAVAPTGYFNFVTPVQAPTKQNSNSMLRYVDGILGLVYESQSDDFSGVGNFFKYTNPILNFLSPSVLTMALLGIAHTPATNSLCNGCFAAGLGNNLIQFLSASNVFNFTFGTNSQSFQSNLSCGFSVPFFAAISCVSGSSGPLHFVLKNLRDGTVQTHTKTAFTTLSDVTGVHILSIQNQFNQAYNGIAACMVAFAYHNIDELVAWSENPWEFWYPRPRFRRGGIASFFLRPDADNTTGTWTPSTGSDLFAMIDETVVDDADFIRSADNPSNDITIVTLSDPTTGKRLKDPFTVRYRYKKHDTGTISITVTLRQGSTQIAQWVHSSPTTSFQTASQTVTGSEYAAITDWTNLRLEFKANV